MQQPEISIHPLIGRLHNNNKGGLDFSYPPVYNLIKKGNQMQDLMPSVKFNFFLC